MLRQPLVLSTVSIGTFVAVLLVEADLVERGVKIVISMPASCSTDLIHLARVSSEAGLYGFDIVINKQVMLPLNDLVSSAFCISNICIFIDWEFYFSHMDLNTSSFNLSSIRIIRKFSSVVVFRMFITDTISLPR